MVTSNSFTLDNREAGTYTFEVSVFCEGDWSLKGKIITMSMGDGAAGTFTKPAAVATNLAIIHLYPNPTTNQIRWSFATDITEEVVLRVTDLLGRGVEHQENITSAVQTVRLPIADYTEGVYYLSINNGAAVRT